MRLTTGLGSLHWRRGLRAGFAVASAMIVCRLLGQPMGWAALGGFEATLVDNGGPYRSRMETIATVILGGALCGVIGTLAPQNLLVAPAIAGIVCFAVTYARVASQPIASTAVVILVIFFAGFGSADRTPPAAMANVLHYALGGLWAGAIGLFLWPVDPFRPARLEVAGCYDLLADFTASLDASRTTQDRAGDGDERSYAVGFKRQLRSKLESAQAALRHTNARSPVRTVRARNLSVLLETADLLFAATVRLTELSEFLPGSASEFRGVIQWLSGAERAIADGLRTRPADQAASFSRRGSHSLQYLIRPAEFLRESTRAGPPEPGAVEGILLADQRDALENLRIAFDAVWAVWTGSEVRPARAAALEVEASEPVGASSGGSDWLDALRENWTLESIMMRHALRIALVSAFDVLIILAFHIGHGFWLAMTSIIVLQPYSAGSVRKGLQRVAGTVGGGILAAILAALVHTSLGIITVIAACSVLTLATYAIDYGWYSFFLTPTFVLLSLPYMQDWRFAGVRVVTTLLGALAAVVAMRVLWPQRVSQELGRLLARSAAANAAYLRAVLRVWRSAAAGGNAKESRELAAARRVCGLASQDAEEALDRVMLEPSLPSLGVRLNRAQETDVNSQGALTFTTYIRRFTQCLTVLASAGTPDTGSVARLEILAERLDCIGAAVGHGMKTGPCGERKGAPMDEPLAEYAASSAAAVFGFHQDSLGGQMLQRMERQAGILERTAYAMAGEAIPAGPPPQSRPEAVGS
jgi:uncharacterized membrane protein YccC